MTKQTLHMAILLTILAIGTVSGLLYITFSNAYQLQSKEFRYRYNNDLYEAFGKCVGDGVFYNGAATLVDTLSRDFQEELETLVTKEQKKQAKKDFFATLQKELRIYDNLDGLWSDFCNQNNLDWGFEYAILLHHVGILYEDTMELVIYDKKPAEPSVRLLGTLKDFNDDNYLMLARSKVNNRCLLKYSLYVDTPARNRLILSDMLGVIGLSILTILSIIMALLYSLKNWLMHQKLSAMKSNFINNVSHELKTPLTTIAIANKSLQKEKVLENPELAKGMLEVIDRQSKRLQRLITQVLDLTIWEKEDFNLKTNQLSMHELIETVVHDFNLKEHAKKVELDYDLKATRDLVKVDAFHFTTILNNLLDNAVKYSKDEVNIKISSKDDKNGLELAIQDDGIGMDQQTVNFVFNKFYRAQAGNVHNVKGLGLGLYYVKKSVEAHGGKIWVKSKKGKGSTFYLTMNT